MNAFEVVRLTSVACAIRAHQAKSKHLQLLDLPLPREVVIALASAGGEVDLEEAFAAICSVWSHEARLGDWSWETVDKYAQAARRFIDQASSEGYTTLDGAALVAEDWVFGAVQVGDGVADASISTLHFRRAVLRAFYVTGRALGLTSLRPLLDLELPARNPESMRRPVDDGEMWLLRETADTIRGQRGPVTLALGRCGAATGEMGEIFTDDVHLDTGLLALPGDNRLEYRVVRIATEWDHQVLTEHMAGLKPGQLLLGTDRTGNGVQSAMSATLSSLLTRARLSDREQVVPNSIRAWAASRVYEDTGDLFATARFLGLTSLDKTVTLLGLDWVSRGDEPAVPLTRKASDPDHTTADLLFLGPGLAS